MSPWMLMVAGAVALGLPLALLLVWGYMRHEADPEGDLEARLRSSFAELAGKALRENADMFLKLARESFAREQAGAQAQLRERELALSQMVDPIRQALDNTGAQLQGFERERRDAFTSLRTQIEQLTLGQQALQRETRNLVGALRRPEVRGRWGEVTLRRVVELAGMSEHCDFSLQETVSTAAGSLRPDLVLRMPEGRELVVDAKTPLDAYLDAIDAATEDLRAAALTRHGQQVEARVRELAGKAYWNQFRRSPEFAVLFLPGDQFLSAALAVRPQLLETAMRQGVVLATPATLMALFKTVAHGWRQAAVAEHAERILEHGQELHRRLGIFVAHLERTGKRLGDALDAHNSALASLERNVLPQARRFNELGAAAGEPLPVLERVEGMVRSAQLHPDDKPVAGSVTDA
jgi:DNA recombination protein RmuC